MIGDMGRGRGTDGADGLLYGGDLGDEVVIDAELQRQAALSAEDHESWLLVEDIFDALYCPPERYKKMSPEERERVKLIDNYPYVFDPGMGRGSKDAQCLKAMIAAVGGKPMLRLEAHSLIANPHEDSFDELIYHGKSLNDLARAAKEWGDREGFFFANHGLLQHKLRTICDRLQNGWD